jgi:hypothetical protein
VTHAVTPTRAGQVRPKLDQICADAVDFARDAVTEDIAGPYIEAVAEGERLVTHYFECTMAGYRGWRWAVTVARTSRSKQVTICETVLLPGPDALTTPDWVPWNERVQPGDLGVGDLMPTAADDDRLVPGYLLSDDPAVDDVVWELGLGRVRVMSPEGRIEAAERWYEGESGPHAPIAMAAPANARCVSCGFFLPLAGSMSALFGACANLYAPDDGRVVSADHGCGAHSEVLIEQTVEVDEAPTIYDDAEVEPVAVIGAGEVAEEDTIEAVREAEAISAARDAGVDVDAGVDADAEVAPVAEVSVTEIPADVAAAELAVDDIDVIEVAEVPGASAESVYTESVYTEPGDTESGDTESVDLEPVAAEASLAPQVPVAEPVEAVTIVEIPEPEVETVETADPTPDELRAVVETFAPEETDEPTAAAVDEISPAAISPAEVERVEVERVEVERAEVERAEVERAEVERAEVEQVEVESVQAERFDQAEESEIIRTEVEPVAEPFAAAWAEDADAEVGPSEAARADVEQSDVELSEAAQAEVGQAEVESSESAWAGAEHAEVGPSEIARADVEQSDVESSEPAWTEAEHAEVGPSEITQAEIDTLEADAPETDASAAPEGDEIGTVEVDAVADPTAEELRTVVETFAPSDIDVIEPSAAETYAYTVEPADSSEDVTVEPVEFDLGSEIPPTDDDDVAEVRTATESYERMASSDSTTEPVRADYPDDDSTQPTFDLGTDVTPPETRQEP